MDVSENRKPRSFRCTDEVWTLIESAAQKMGMTASDFIVNAVTKAANDQAVDNPLTLTPATQERLVRGLFMLVIDRHRQLINENKESHLKELVARAEEILNATQHDAIDK